MLQRAIAFDPDHDAEIFAAIPIESGVFILRGADVNAEPYVGKAANLRRRITRLLAPTEKQSKRLNLRERCVVIEWSQTGSDFENVVLLYRALREIFPEAYGKRLRLNLSPLIRIHWENPYPRAYVTRKLGRMAQDDEKVSAYYGPFRSRASADKFLNDTLDLFKSRRCNFELNPDPVFPGCIYSEMKMCLAPCFKGCTDVEYLAEMHRVQDFLESCGSSLIEDLSTQREKASADLEFETAATLHARIEKVKGVVQGCDQIIRRADQLDALVVQPSSTAEAVNLFRFAQCQIIGPVEFNVSGMALSNDKSGSSSLFAQPLMLQPIALNDAGETSPVMLRPEVRLHGIVASLLPATKISVTQQAEHLAILKRWYYRSSRSGEIFIKSPGEDWPWRRILNGTSRVFTGGRERMQEADVSKKPSTPLDALAKYDA